MTLASALVVRGTSYCQVCLEKVLILLIFRSWTLDLLPCGCLVVGGEVGWLG